MVGRCFPLSFLGLSRINGPYLVCLLDVVDCVLFAKFDRLDSVCFIVCVELLIWSHGTCDFADGILRVPLDSVDFSPSWTPDFSDLRLI